MAYSDGTFTSGKQDGPRRTTYPFANGPVPDAYARIHSRKFRIYPASGYVPATATRTSYTNYCLQSESYGTAPWGVSEGTIGANLLANPWDGAVTFDKLQETNTASVQHQFFQALAIAAGVTTYSEFFKQAERTKVQLTLNNATDGNFATAVFDLASGTVNSVISGSAGIQAVGYGIYRCWITGTSTITNSAIYRYPYTTSNTYTGTTGYGVYAGGGQAELASTPGPYIPTTTVSRTVSAPNVDKITETVDGDDYFAYLVSESELSLEGAVGTFERQYARVPADQVSYPDSIYVTLPTPPEATPTAKTTYLVNSVTGAQTQLAAAALYLASSGLYYPWHGNNKFFGPSSGTVIPTLTVATGGTFTITFGANTTAALNWNDSAGTIQTAINGLASVIAAGLTVTVIGNNLGTAASGVLNLTFSIPVAAMFTMTSSLTPAAASTVHSYYISSTNQAIRIDLRAAITAHGISTSAPLSVTTGPYSREYPTTQFSAPDANTIAFAAGPIAGSANYTAADYYIGGYLRAYTPTTRLIGTKQTDSFYLPGVTTGITTGADIPRTTGLQTNQALLDALLTTSGFQSYRSEGPRSWLGPIYKQMVVAINMNDIT